MAKITRKYLKLFGATAPSDDVAQFGSRAAASPAFSKDPDVIQSLTAWFGGIKSSLLSGVRAMFAEDLNSVLYVLSYGLCNLQQDGIPEWNASTPYYIGSVVRKVGTFEMYGSKTNDNTGNALPNKTGNTNWEYLNPPTEFPGVVKEYGGATAPFGYLMCDGSAVNRTTYADLFAAIGETFGAGNGTTTFNVPDRRGRMSIGVGTGAGLTDRVLGTKYGVEAVNLQHSHGVSFSNSQDISTGQDLVTFSNPKAVLGIAALGGGDTAYLRGLDIGINNALGSTSVLNPVIGMNFIIKI